MQLKQHVSFGFTTSSIADKLVFGGKVSTAIGTNAATFPAMPFNKAAIDAANADLNTKTIAAAGGDASALDARNVSEKSWNKIFRDNGVYIDFVAKGDVTIINKSGYTPTKDQTQATVAPDVLSGFTTSVDGMSNAIKLSVNADSNVDAFAFIAGTSGVSVQQSGNQLNFTIGTEKIIIVFDTHRSVTLQNLVSHVPLQVQALGINVAGASQLTNAKTVSPQ